MATDRPICEGDLFTLLSQLIGHLVDLKYQIALFCVLLGNDPEVEERFIKFAAEEYGIAIEPETLRQYREEVPLGGNDSDGEVAEDQGSPPGTKLQ